MKNIVHFSNGKGGGVQTIIDNIITLSSNKSLQYRVVYTIRIEEHEDSFEQAIVLRENDLIFKYSRFENTYFVFKRLSKLLKDENEIIVSHDWLELGMISRLGLKNKVLFFLHADIDYYYNLAIAHKYEIDYFICYSRVIEKKLIALNKIPHTSIKYLIYPVANIFLTKSFSYPLRIIYCVNYLDELRKNFALIIDLVKKLTSENILWTIVGKSKLGLDYFKDIDPKKLEYYPSLPNNQVIEIMKHQHLFLLPSYHEGLPVTLIEAMKCGVIPLVSAWNGAASDLIEHEQNGFILNPSPDEYISIIKGMLIKIEDIEALSIKAKQSVECFCNHNNSINKLESVYSLPTLNKSKNPVLLYSSTLDKKYIPNFLVKLIRKMIY